MKSTSQRSIFLTLCLALSVAAGGCASGGSGGDSAGSTSFREEIGKVMERPVTLARDKIFGRFTIPMLREESTARTIYWETQWMPRDPSPEELAAGATGARNRIIMRGTFSEERLDRTPVFRMRFEAENQIRTQLNPEWHPGIMPPVAEERFQEIYDNLMLELRTGVIR